MEQSGDKGGKGEGGPMDVRAEGPEGPGEGFGDWYVCGERGVCGSKKSVGCTNCIVAGSMDVVFWFIATAYDMVCMVSLLHVKNTEK